MIFDFKRFQALSNSTEKNIFEKLEDLEETIRVNNIEIKDQIKDLNSTLNTFIADEFQFMKKLMKGQKNGD
jgi:phage shock protein A